MNSILLKMHLFINQSIANMEFQKSSQEGASVRGAYDSSVYLGSQTLYSKANLYLSYGCYFAGILCGLTALWFFYRSSKINILSFDQRKRLFFIAIAFCIASIALFFLPKFFFLNVSFPGNFDPRTT